MGKSAVLKDQKNRPAGYLRREKDAIICQTGLEKPAQLMLVLADGSKRVFELKEGRGEQRFSCEGADMTGGCVFCGDELLMVSDERMQQLFENRMRKGVAKPTMPEREQPALKRENKPPERHVFAQRRWPPPPCWDAAQYREGKWQEG